MIRPFTLTVARCIREYYKLHEMGGPLHIVLDDYNIETEHILWCTTDDNPKPPDMLTHFLAAMMMELTIEERYYVVRGWENID
jgi:hypothetical protein